jgi:hypothetical protein
MPTRTGGHLVLVTGHADGLVSFHDPAGHTPHAALGVYLYAGTIAASTGGRALPLGRPLI